MPLSPRKNGLDSLFTLGFARHRWDTPISRAMGFWVSHLDEIGCDTPPPSMRTWGAIPPVQEGYLSDTCAIPLENKAKCARYPLCGTISKRYCAILRGISHWAGPLSCCQALVGHAGSLHFQLLQEGRDVISSNPQNADEESSDEKLLLTWNILQWCSQSPWFCDSFFFQTVVRRSRRSRG